MSPFPNVDDGRQLISTDGGTRPLWGPDGQELFYVTGRRLMVVPVGTTAARLEVGSPTPLFEGPYASTEGGRTYDVSADGQRFLMIKPLGAVDEPAQIHVAVNWTQELLERVPVP